MSYTLFHLGSQEVVGSAAHDGIPEWYRPRVPTAPLEELESRLQDAEALDVPIWTLYDDEVAAREALHGGLRLLIAEARAARYNAEATFELPSGTKSVTLGGIALLGRTAKPWWLRRELDGHQDNREWQVLEENLRALQASRHR